MTGLFCFGPVTHLVSTSMDGTIHIYKLGSLTVTNSLDDDLGAVRIEQDPFEPRSRWTIF